MHPPAYRAVSDEQTRAPRSLAERQVKRTRRVRTAELAPGVELSDLLASPRPADPRWARLRQKADTSQDGDGDPGATRGSSKLGSCLAPPGNHGSLLGAARKLLPHPQICKRARVGPSRKHTWKWHSGGQRSLWLGQNGLIWRVDLPIEPLSLYVLQVRGKPGDSQRHFLLLII